MSIWAARNIRSFYYDDLPLSESIHFNDRCGELFGRIEDETLVTRAGDRPPADDEGRRTCYDEIMRWQVLMLLVDPELGVLAGRGAAGRDLVLRVARLYARWLRGEHVDDDAFNQLVDEFAEEEPDGEDEDPDSTPTDAAERLEWSDSADEAEHPDRDFARTLATEAASFSGGFLLMYEVLARDVAREGCSGVPHWARAPLTGENVYERAFDTTVDVFWYAYRFVRRRSNVGIDHLRAQAGFFLRLVQLRWNPATDRERTLFRELMGGQLANFEEYAGLLREDFVEPDEIHAARETFERLAVLRSQVPLDEPPRPAVDGEVVDGRVADESADAAILGRTYASGRGGHRVSPDVLDENDLEDRFDSDVIERARQAPAGRTLNQRIVYALLSHTFEHHRTPWSEAFVTVIAYAFVAALMVAVGLAYLAVPYYAFHWLLGSWTDGVVYLLLSLALVVVLAIRVQHDSSEVEFKSAPVDRLDLGRMEHAFDFALFGLFLCCLFGMQWGLLQYTHDRLGLLPDGSFEDRGWVALDNVLSACLFDVYEMYELERRPVEHDTWSASVFLVFRTSYNVLFLLAVYNLWQRWRCGPLMRRFPAERLSYGRFAGWLTREMRAPGRWAVLLLDEAVFLRIVAAYLRDDFDEVRRTSHRFPRIRVANELRALFVDERGELLFEGFTTT